MKKDEKPNGIYRQLFIITARKPLVYNNDTVYGLSIVVNTKINKILKEVEKYIWDLFIDDEFKPNDLSPLLLVPSQESVLLKLEERDLNDITYSIEFYKDVYQDHIAMNELNGEVPLTKTVAIDKKEFYELLNNQLHFQYQDNLPCQTEIQHVK
ncbi:hypothetical protein FX738_08660 [Campylobacter jejuni]|nr:hypothetical protein [Campylobacter jejuni]